MPSYNKPIRLKPGDRTLSSKTWNGFVELYEDKYRRTGTSADPLNRPVPPMLQSSHIALAMWSPNARGKKLGGYKPVRIVSVSNSKISPVTSVLTYLVEPVEMGRDVVSWAPNANKVPSVHEGYAFTMAEGMSDKGGRIVIGGLALAAIDNDWGFTDATRASDSGIGDVASEYYSVNDNSLFPSATSGHGVIQPVGHFKIISHVSYEDLDGKGTKTNNNNVNAKYVLLDLEKDCGSFMAYLPDTLNSFVTTGDTFPTTGRQAISCTPATGYASYLSNVDTTDESPLFDTEGAWDGDTIQGMIEDEILIFNFTGGAVAKGWHTVTYSRVYNRFIIVGGGMQTAKIGKADADIAVGTTGTISIWRDGSDTTENETAKLDWMAGTTQVSSGKEVMITWFADEGIWRITGAECES